MVTVRQIDNVHLEIKKKWKTYVASLKKKILLVISKRTV